ncbi:unnamed protein product [Ilex paraguariensis]|uniref:Major facilitator superfamily (MFS) profile domain-containing protein n=1 Tax=Ilex paraguariensis TaxID=185542 RepID=A0ABC8RDK1_9AQUA
MAENELQDTLLGKKIYYENCPGCKVDQYKEMQRGLPIKELVTIWIVVLCTALPISSLFPFLYFMIRDFQIAKREEDIGFYAGFVGSSFMLGRALTSVFWGIMADRYGRKPIIIIGTSTVVVFNTLFGLSVNYWMAISTRFLLGSLNGLLGPIKIRDFQIAKREEDIGFYAGFVGSSFMLGRALTSVFWGIMADRYGRKPIIIIGTSTVVVFNTLFGLSVNYWMAISTRFLLGSLNGLLGPIKAYATEIFREEYQALGLSAVSTAWGIGLIIGPALGGFLAQAALGFWWKAIEPGEEREVIEE